MLSGGLAQLGWAQLAAAFTHEMGVGDLPGSYAYDGHRLKKWNVSQTPYGVQWVQGDVITIALDMNEHTVTFCRNGVSMGVAFGDLPAGADVAFFPAVSLSAGESVRFNFGAQPLRFPLEGYQVSQETQHCPEMADSFFFFCSSLLSWPIWSAVPFAAV